MFLLRAFPLLSALALTGCAQAKFMIVSDPKDAQVFLWAQDAEEPEETLADGAVRAQVMSAWSAGENVEVEGRRNGAPPDRVQIVAWDMEKGGVRYFKNLTNATQRFSIWIAPWRWIWVKLIWDQPEAEPAPPDNP